MTYVGKVGKLVLPRTSSTEGIEIHQLLIADYPLLQGYLRFK
jgi:hypothetical protein